LIREIIKFHHLIFDFSLQFEGFHNIFKVRILWVCIIRSLFCHFWRLLYDC